MKPTWQNYVAGLVGLDFAAFTAYVLATTGPVHWLTQSLADVGTTLILVDLCIALAAFSIWMVKDARATGRNPWGYLALTALTGSVGPMLYLTLKDWRTTPVPTRIPRPGVAAA